MFAPTVPGSGNVTVDRVVMVAGRVAGDGASVGKAGDETAGHSFIAQNPPLAFYTEPTYALAYAFRPPVDEMPTTLIYDKAGIERARLSGGADWSGPDAKAVIETLMAGG